MNGIMGIYGSANGTGRIELKRTDGTVVGAVTVSGSGKNKKSGGTKKKKLQYSFKEISTQLMQTRTSGAAGRVLLSARAKAAMLRRKLNSGEYDDQELEYAIRHADAMVRVAKKRMRHLQEEENAKSQGGPCQAELEEKWDEQEEKWDDQEGGPAQSDPAEDADSMDLAQMQRLMREYRKLMQETQKMEEEALQDMPEAEELSEEIGGFAEGETDPADLELMKKKHRARELREIMEADMKYLRAMFDKMEKEKQASASGAMQGGESYDSGTDSGVILDLSQAGMPMEAPPVDVSSVVEGAAIDACV